MDDRIIELLPRNLQEVFGEGDAARRRAAIEDFYTDDCVLHVLERDGTFVGHAALDRFAGELRAPSAFCLHTARRAAGLHDGGFSRGAAGLSPSEPVSGPSA